MEKIAERKVTLGDTEFTITICRSITFIKGDGWDRSDETLYIENKKISFVDHQRKKRTGTCLHVLKEQNRFDKKMIDNGAYGSIPGTGLGLKKESFELIKEAYDEVSKEAMFDEWIEYINAKETAKRNEKIESAEESIREGDAEIKECGKLLTIDEIKKWRRNYNNIMNEGGDGYIPRRVSIEEYNQAKKVLLENK